MKIILISLALFLSACSNHKHVLTIPVEIRPYYTDFIALIDKHAPGKYTRDDLIIKFKTPSTNSTIIGMCIRELNNAHTPIILISPKYWDEAGIGETEEERDARRRVLLYHELGHCILHLPHNEELIDSPFGKIPKSIMFTFAIPAKIFIYDRERYESELFMPPVKNSMIELSDDVDQLPYDHDFIPIDEE